MKWKKWLLPVLALCAVLMTGRQAVAAEGIQIDGYFDDWEGIPKTGLTYGSTNKEEFHDSAVLLDGENLCVYVKMSELYQTQIPLQQYHIEINGTEKMFYIWHCNEDGSINWAKDTYNLGNGSFQNGFGVFCIGSNEPSLGDAAIMISDGNPNDTLEFSIPVETLERLYGFPKGTIGGGARATGVTIRMWNPNLGGNKVTLTGTSTGPFVGIALCFATAGGFWLYRRKGKRLA